MASEHPLLEFDLRSDAVTQPTEEMWQAMRTARLGWAPFGDDESVERLEALAADMTGKEAALLVPTGSMGNLVAIMVQTQPGEQVVLEASSHILWSEDWGIAALCGVFARAVEGELGVLDPARVDAVIRETRSGHRPRTALVCLENTHNGAGGALTTPEQTAALCQLSHRHSAAVHLDGARAFNAAVATGVPLLELVHEVDSIMLNLNKGLSAPFGALLCGSQEFVVRARAVLPRLGGASIHQAGLFAAAGIIALEQMIDRLAEDHRRARLLAGLLTEVDGIEVDASTVQTNIVMVRVNPDLCAAAELRDRLRTQRIGAFVYGEQQLRFVTHRHVTDAAVTHVVREVAAALRADAHVGTSRLPAAATEKREATLDPGVVHGWSEALGLGHDWQRAVELAPALAGQLEALRALRNAEVGEREPSVSFTVEADGGEQA